MANLHQSATLSSRSVQRSAPPGPLRTTETKKPKPATESATEPDGDEELAGVGVALAADVAGLEEGQRGVELREEPQDHEHEPRVAPAAGGDQALPRPRERMRDDACTAARQKTSVPAKAPAVLASDVVERGHAVGHEELQRLHREAERGAGHDAPWRAHARRGFAPRRMRQASAPSGM